MHRAIMELAWRRVRNRNRRGVCGKLISHGQDLKGLLMMNSRKNAFPLLATLFTAICLPMAIAAQSIPTSKAIDAEVSKIMARTHSNGMAVAVVDHGKIADVNAYGTRNADGDPLTTATVMYGASLTKTVFAYTVMQLVDEGR